MMDFFIWLEQTGLSTWVREAPTLWAFPFILYLHTLGLALLVGISTAFALRLIAFPDRYPLAPARQFFPVMWLGFGINAVSGILLLVAYPAKALTNPVFYVKLAAVLAAVAILKWIDGEVFVKADPSPTAAVSRAVTGSAAAVIVLWIVATGTGRFLAYTHSMLMAGDAVF